jgi:hypothetical protein
MPSKLIEDARALTEALTTACEKHLPTASDAIDQDQVRRGFASFSLAQHLDNGAAIQASFDALEAADRLLEQEGIEDTDARKDRDAAREQLYKTVSALGTAVATAYGRDSVARLALAGNTPRATAALTQAARAFLVATQTMPALPEPLEPWNTPNLSAARERVITQLDALTQAQNLLAREQRETQLARVNRDRAHELWFSDLRFHLDLLRAAFSRAKEAELADRILPTRRQLTAVEPDPDENPTAPLEDPISP